MNIIVNVFPVDVPYNHIYEESHTLQAKLGTQGGPALHKAYLKVWFTTLVSCGDCIHLVEPGQAFLQLTLCSNIS